MWPRVEFEERDWIRDPEDLALIPKSRRRKITSSYLAALPPFIADHPVQVSSDLAQHAAEACAMIARFDQEQASKGYNLPALMLRSESSSSSQIEHLTSSARNIALADLTDKAPQNAKLIAGNVAAMRTALGQEGPVNSDSICAIHRALMGHTPGQGGFRAEQVWIGGTFYSPHGALFVPPHESRVSEYVEDLSAFARRQDILPVIKAAIFHAQFETIHPFTDGNGRTGRALLHRMLANDEVLFHSALPISAGLLHDVDSYMAALDAYHNGEIEPIVECLLNALEVAVFVGSRIAVAVDAVLEGWVPLLTERKGSAMHRLPSLLVEQPVVNAAYLSEKLELGERAARNLLDSACQKGILTKIGNAKRGVFYQAPELLDVLESASSIQGIRRMAIR